jgi:hypothetical protein
LKDFNDIEMVPVPHRNTINFLGMQAKQNYLIWREVNGDFTALDAKTTEVKAWSIATGKITTPAVTVGIINVDDYELYQSCDADYTYKRNWQQHPNHSIAILKSKKEIEYYDANIESILAEK